MTATAWGLRGTRKAEEAAERARLKVADVVAEARERIGEEAPPPAIARHLRRPLALTRDGADGPVRRRGADAGPTPRGFAIQRRRGGCLEDAVEKIPGVRAVHAYPRTASVVVWYSPKRCDTAAILDAIENTPRRRAVRPGALPRTALGRRRQRRRRPDGGRRDRAGAAGVSPLRVRAVRRCWARRAGSSPPASRSSPAIRSCAALCAPCAAAGPRAPTRWSPRRRREPGAARERRRPDGAVAAEHRRVPAGSDAAPHPPGHRGSAAGQPGHRLGAAARRQRGRGRDRLRSAIGDEVVVHEQVVLPVDGVVVDGEAVVDQSAITGENLPVTVAAGDAGARRLGGAARPARGARRPPSAPTPPSGGSSSASRRPSATGRPSRPSARTSPGASSRRPSCCRR